MALDIPLQHRVNITPAPQLMLRVRALVDTASSDPANVAAIAPLAPLLDAVAEAAIYDSKPAATAYPDRAQLIQALSPVFAAGLSIVRAAPEVRVTHAYSIASHSHPAPFYRSGLTLYPRYPFSSNCTPIAQAPLQSSKVFRLLRSRSFRSFSTSWRPWIG